MKKDHLPNWRAYGTEPKSQIVSLDVETYYNTKTKVSLSDLPVWNYVFHPDPRDFKDWDKLTGKTIAMHNASFDALVFKRMQMEGAIPASCQPARFVCTADLCAYMRLAKRSLQFAMKMLYGKDISKSVRTDADGMTARDLKSNSEGWRQMMEYGADDATHCRQIAVDFIDQWPAVYQRVSELNREASWAGVNVDVERILGTNDAPGALNVLQELANKYLNDMPWYPEFPALSAKAHRAQGRKDGIAVPASLAKDSERGREFFEEYKDIAWVQAIKEYRQVNMLLGKVSNLAEGLREDGTFPYQMVFFGANTGRFTGGMKDEDREDSNKFNLLNLPRFELQGIDLRKMIVAPKGHKLFIGDYSQVEARLLLWYAGDRETLRMIEEEGFNVYEAMAIKLLNMAPEEAKGLKDRDPKTYHMVKGMVLGFGYGMAEERFVMQAPQLTGGKYAPTLDESLKAKIKYRSTNPLVPNLWRRHQSALLSSVYNKDATHRIQMASGRWLEYYDPQQVIVVDEKTKKERMEVVVRQTRGGDHNRIYGAKCVENMCQATGADILFDAWCAVVDAGYKPVFTLYDEIVCPVPDDKPEEHGKIISDLMIRSSPWLKGCPLGTEWKLVDRYCK
jgi:hypothetical protein